MKITVYRYLIKEQLTPVGVSLLGLSFVMVTGRLLQFIGYLFASSASFFDIAELVLLAMPKLMLFALPMATLLGICIAFTRLNGDNELVALRSAGVGFRQLLPPVAAVLLFIASAAMANSLYVIPFSNQAFEAKLKTVGKDSLPAFLKEGSFIDVFPKMVFYFRSVDPSNLSVNGIFVQDQRREDLRTTIIAENGHIAFQRDTNQLILKISNGIITRVPDNLKDAQSVTFREYDLNISMNELFGGTEKNGKNKNHMTLGELLREIREREGAAGIRYSLELHERLALPISCLLLGLIAAPLGAMFRHKGRMTGIALGLSIFIAYYVLFSAGNGLAKNGLISASTGVWTPNILTALLAAALWKRAHQERPSILGYLVDTFWAAWRARRCIAVNRDSRK